MAIVTDALELSIVDRLLNHAQKDHSTNPELNPQQVSPVTSRESQPQHAHKHVDDAHHHVELRTMGKKLKLLHIKETYKILQKH